MINLDFSCCGGCGVPCRVGGASQSEAQPTAPARKSKVPSPKSKVRDQRNLGLWTLDLGLLSEVKNDANAE